MAFSLILACFIQHRVFFDHYAINDDVRNQIYWMARIREPELFKNDYIASYFTQSSFISPVLYCIYNILSCCLDPIRLSQILPFPLVLFATFFLFKIAEASLNSRYAFWVSYVFNLFVWSCSNLSGGLARAFFYPLTFLFLWLYTTRNYIWIIPCLCLQCLTYPTVFFVSVLMIIIELILDRRKPEQREKILYSLAAIVSGLFVLAYRYLKTPIDHKFGQLVNIKDALSMPEFYLNGRIKVFPFTYGLFSDHLVIQKLNEAVCSIHFKGFVLGAVLILVLFLLRKRLILYRTLLPRLIWSVFFSSIILYIFALIMMFYLYLPQRYLQYGVPVLLVFLAGGLLYQIDCSIESKKRYRLILMAISLLLIFSLFWEDDLISLGQNKKMILRYLQSLPGSATIAAPLNIADNIPAFSHKSIFISNESDVPFHKNYYKKISSRMLDWNNAYYSDKPEIVEDFIRGNKIDYIIVDHNDFQSKSDKFVLNNIPSKCHPIFFNCYKVIPGIQINQRRCLRK